MSEMLIVLDIDLKGQLDLLARHCRRFEILPSCIALVLSSVGKNPLSFTAKMLFKLDISSIFDTLSSVDDKLLTFAIKM